jgi:NADPH:quinone reductase-like Zn-dependent oxidoreductase
MKRSIAKIGSPDDLVVRDIPPPGAPGDGRVQVAIQARGVAFTDVLMVAGQYQVKPELPFIVGGEGAGRITAVGANVAGLRVGDAVLAPSGCVEMVNVAAAPGDTTAGRCRSRSRCLVPLELCDCLLRDAARATACR